MLRIGPEGTTVYIGDYYEKRGSVVTKYYDAGGQRMAVRVGGALYFLHGDHLGSATLTTDISGNRVGELRYTPYGVTRYEWGNIPTDRRYTGQRWEAFGLYDYGARMYSPGLGRFVSADIVVVAPDKPQNLNRYAYVYNSPLRYTDPSGLIAQQEAERAQEIIALLQREYRLFVRIDFGWRFLPVMHPVPGEPTALVIWEEGMWQLIELELLFEAVSDLASAMGGAERFRENLRGVWVERAVMRYAGLGAAHRIVLNAGGFTKWTVVHELAHAWDAVRGWRLSKEMQEAMGAGFAHPIRHFFNPGNPAWWYDPGQGPPPCGIDANFNGKEDFAEAVTAYVYPDRASQWAAERGWPYMDPGRGYAYASFLETPRGQFIVALLTDHNRR